MNRFMFAFAFAFSFAALAACTSGESVETTTSSLTVDQCDYFADGAGSVTFCHATSSAKNPFVVITTNVEGCINGHEDHAGDKIAIDGKCTNACFPPGAPIDESLGEKCCDGTKAVDGWCVDACVPNACQKGGKFDIDKGECFFDNFDHGTECNDGDVCTQKDFCDGQGTCIGYDEDPKCGCSADAQFYAMEHYAKCISPTTPIEECIAGAKKVFYEYYGRVGCSEEPKEFQPPASK